MIPTRHKAKLPRHLSYPVGSKDITEGLAGVPRVDLLSVAFLDQAIWPGSEFRRLLAGRLPHKVMEARYGPAGKPGISGAKHMVDMGWYDEKWELSVYPVLVEFRHVANQLLRDQGLPAVARWLRSAERAGWGMKSRWIVLVFNAAAGSLAASEGSGA